MAGGTSLVLIRMGGRPCAIPCEHVFEIISKVTLDHVPDAPAEVLGVINFRGRVVPIVDIRRRVSKADSFPPYQHLVIVRAHGRHVGIAVDEVRDVLSVPDEAVERPGQLAGVRSPGVVRIDDDLVLVIDPEDAFHAAP